jgi:glutamyl-tRNA synthetase
LITHLEAKTGAPLSESQSVVLGRSVSVLKKRAKTLLELADQAAFLLATRPLVLDPAAKSHMKDDFRQRLARLRERLAAAPTWEHAELSSVLKAFATDEGVGLGQIGPGLRAALTGGSPSPDLGQTLELLGRDEALARIADQI